MSLVPFDKKELMAYITNYKADYAVYFCNLMAFHKNALYREDIPYYGCRTRINENIWKYFFQPSMNQKQRMKSTIHI